MFQALVDVPTGFAVARNADWSHCLVMEINASEFKARCLAILDEVARTGEKVVILKRGRPVAELVSPVGTSAEFAQDALRGTVEVLGDVVSPAVEPSEWEAEAGESPG